jgi:hypothetical protein
MTDNGAGSEVQVGATALSGGFWHDFLFRRVRKIAKSDY